MTMILSGVLARPSSTAFWLYFARAFASPSDVVVLPVPPFLEVMVTQRPM